MLYSKFCYKAAPDREKMFGPLQGTTARDYFRFPEEPEAILGDIRGVMERADRFQLDPIFKNVRAQVKHTLELSSAHQKRHFHDRMIADEKERLNIFQRFRFGRRKQRFEDMDTMAKYHVDLPGYMTASGIMAYFSELKGVEYPKNAEEKDLTERQRDAKYREEMLESLKERLGTDVVNNPQNHPVFLWAIAGILQTPTPPGPYSIFRKVLPPVSKIFMDSDLKKKAFDEVNKNSENLDHLIHEIEENGGHDFLKKLVIAKKNFLTTKNKLDKALTDDVPDSTGTTSEDKKTAKAGYDTKISALKESTREAKEQFEKLYVIYRKFHTTQDTFFKKLSVLIYPDPTLEPDPDNPGKSRLKGEFGPFAHPHYKAFMELKKKYLLHGIHEEESGELDIEYQGFEIKFNSLLDALVNNQFHAEFSPIKKQVTSDIDKVKKFEDVGKTGDEKGPVFMTEQEFLYKVIFYRRTNTIENGGVLPNGTKLNQYQIADMKPDIVHETLLNMMEARSLKLMTDANKFRMERYTKNALRSNLWTRLFGQKYPMKNLPPLDTALKRIRILEMDQLDEKGEPVKDDKGNVVKERPFAHLKLKGKMDLADLRKLVSEGYLKKQDIPRLIGHLESVLAGYERYQIREKDLVPLLNLIKSLQTLRVFHLHDQFKKNAEGDPDHLDLVIAGLWKNDLKISEKVAADSQKKLFQILRGDYKGSASYKKQADALISEAKEKYTDKETGEFDFAAAKEFLQDHGVAFGLGGLGLYLAGKKLRLGTKLKNWLPKTKAEQTGKIAEAGLARKLGYGAIQAVKGTPRFLWNTGLGIVKSPYTIPRGIYRKVAKPVLDKLGVTKVAGKIGNGIVSGGKIVGGMAKKEAGELFSSFRHAARQLPDKLNIFNKGGGHGGGH